MCFAMGARKAPNFVSYFSILVLTDGRRRDRQQHLLSNDDWESADNFSGRIRQTKAVKFLIGVPLGHIKRPNSGRERSHRLRQSKRMFPCRREDLSKAIQFRTCHLLNFVKHTETRLQPQGPQLGASGPPVIDDSDGGSRRTERQPRCGPQGNVFKPELTRALPAFCSSTNVAFSLANKPSKVFRSASEVTTDASLRSLSKFLSLINLSISGAFPFCD